MQAITMFQPKAILQTSDGDSIVSVEMSHHETRICVHHHDSLTLPLSTYLSDEADRHYALRHIEESTPDRVYVFDSIPTTTRIFDIIVDHRHRWMGVHSAIRAIRFPAVRLRYDESAIIPDSIDRIVHDISLEDLLDDNVWYHAMKACLPLYRDYVSWKWKLPPNAIFLLRRLQEKAPQTSSATRHSEVQSPQQTSVISPFTEPQRPRRKNFFQRLFSRSKRKKEQTPSATSQQKPRPLSRFEQKMLQESRTRGN